MRQLSLSKVSLKNRVGWWWGGWRHNLHTNGKSWGEKCGDGRGMYGCLGGLRVPPMVTDDSCVCPCGWWDRLRQKNDLGIDFGLALPLVTHDRGGLEKCGDGRGMYGCLGGLRVPPMVTDDSCVCPGGWWDRLRQKNDLVVDFRLVLPLVTHDRGGLGKCGDLRGM